MNKQALLLGFEKAGRELGLNSLQINTLWNQSLKCPDFRNDFEKMSSEPIGTDVETLEDLDTINQLEQLHKDANLNKLCVS